MKKSAVARARSTFSAVVSSDCVAGVKTSVLASILGRAEADAQCEADRLALAKYAPPRVVVNEDFEIIQFRGLTSRCSEPMRGKASVHVLKMAREGLLLPLRTALQRAKREGEVIRKDGAVVHVNGQPEKVNIEVCPLKCLREPCFLVLFEPSTREEVLERRLAVEAALRKRSGNKKDAAIEIRRLRAEQAAVKECLQFVMKTPHTRNSMRATKRLTRATKNSRVSTRRRRWFSLRALPYRTMDNKIDGAVLVLVDVDAVKRSEERIQAALDYAQSTLETVREPLLVLADNLRVGEHEPFVLHRV